MIMYWCCVCALVVATVASFVFYIRWLLKMTDASDKKLREHVQTTTDQSQVSTTPHYCPLCKNQLKFGGPTLWKATEIDARDVIINEWFCTSCKEQWRLIARVGDHQVNYKKTLPGTTTPLTS